jgi:3-hydroxyacyl-CoA dehydrogenase/enoyl-CoA hydratase/carnithine racemase
VVTRALVRFIDLPEEAGPAALITLDNGRDHTRPNTLGPGGLQALDAALDTALHGVEDVERIRAICITGKPYNFCAGADLTGVAQITDRELALEMGRLGHRVLRRVHESPVPTFAFINGAALGGGLELAMHCTYRTVSTAVRHIGLPECSLGLVPGWGGCYLLPHLIGMDAAVRVAVENPLENNRLLDAGQAFELGLADALLDSADFLEASLTWAAAVLYGQLRVARPEIGPDAERESALDRGLQLANARTRGCAPAPYRALDLLRAAPQSDHDTAFATEDEVLADLLMTDEMRASLYAAELVRRGRSAAATARAPQLRQVGIVGAGLMAGQLGLLFARRLQVPVVLTDVDLAHAEQGVARVQAEVDRLAGRGRVSPDAANRLRALVTAGPGTQALAECDFVIEAVTEDLAVKRQVLAAVEAAVSPSCLLATNTSALPITQMASQLTHPERFVGFHVFNPVARMPLVEVVRGEKSGAETITAALGLAAVLGKIPVEVVDAPGFVVNRLLARLLGEVLGAVDRGVPVVVVDSALDQLGLPMRPLELVGLVGAGVALHVAETLHEAFGDRFVVPRALAQPPPPGALSEESQRAQLLAGGPERAQLLRAAEDALAEEISLMLTSGVVADPTTVDLAMLLGAGWAAFNGGITPYLDRTGTSERVTGNRFLPPGVASLPE